jgi:hypothetical protein
MVGLGTSVSVRQSRCSSSGQQKAWLDDLDDSGDAPSVWANPCFELANLRDNPGPPLVLGCLARFRLRWVVQYRKLHETITSGAVESLWRGMLLDGG